MPLVSQIVKIDGKKLLDGGMSDSIPLKFFQDIGYEKNVVVLTQPIEYRKEKNKMMPLVRLKYKDYPKLTEAMENRHIMYNSETDYVKSEEEKGTAFVIRPKKPLPVSRVEKNPDKLRLAYRIGRKAAEERLEDLKNFLGER